MEELEEIKMNHFGTGSRRDRRAVLGLTGGSVALSALAGIGAWPAVVGAQPKITLKPKK